MMPEHQVRGHFFARRFGSAVRRPPARRSPLRVVRTPTSVLGSGARRSVLRRSLPVRRSLPFGSPGLPIQVVVKLRRIVPRIDLAIGAISLSPTQEVILRHTLDRGSNSLSVANLSTPWESPRRARSRKRLVSLSPVVRVNRQVSKRPERVGLQGLPPLTPLRPLSLPDFR